MVYCAVLALFFWYAQRYIVVVNTMSRTYTPITPLLHEYMTRYTRVEDPLLQELMEQAEAAAIPAIAICPEQAVLLQQLILMLQANMVIELGTLAGYSAIVMARALGCTGGKLVTVEKNKNYADFARQQIRRAQLTERVAVVHADAGDYLLTVRPGTVDMVFIDADKRNYTRYVELAYPLVRQGGVICVDNVLAAGAITLPIAEQRLWVQATHSGNELLLTDQRFISSLIPLGDGMIVAYKRSSFCCSR